MGKHQADPTADVSSRPAWVPMVASGMFHLMLLLMAAAFVTRQNDGTGGAVDRPVGIAVVHRMPDRDRYTEAETIAAKTIAAESPRTDAANPSASSPPPAAAAAIEAIDLDGILDELTTAASPIGSGDGIAGTDGIGTPNVEGTGTDALPGAGQTGGDDQTGTTMVFGVSGTGSRFVYVFDRSDSMNGFGGKPLRAAKSELIRSLRSLTDRQQFAIIFYNDRPTPFGDARGPASMMTAEPGMTTAASRYVRGVTAYGGTEHLSAIRMALRMAPDVIFFLTDAAVPSLSPSQLRDVRGRAQSSGTTIHAIEFGSRPSPSPSTFLRSLAEQNGGRYRYLNVQDL